MQSSFSRKSKSRPYKTNECVHLVDSADVGGGAVVVVAAVVIGVVVVVVAVAAAAIPADGDATGDVVTAADDVAAYDDADIDADVDDRCYTMR